MIFASFLPPVSIVTVCDHNHYRSLSTAHSTKIFNIGKTNFKHRERMLKRTRFFPLRVEILPLQQAGLLL